MKTVLILALALSVQTTRAEEVFDIWDGRPPHFKDNELEEFVNTSSGVPCVHNVTRPTLTVHPASGENTGRAMIVLPGGGYVMESFVAEGRIIAEFLAERGITAAVLKYRLPLEEASDQPHLVPLADARKAIRFLRSVAGDFGIDPSKVGIMGFSAGGHLATAVSVLPGEIAEESPDFSALIYPVTTLSAYSQSWLEETLFHRTMTAAEILQYSLVDHVCPETPPAFLLHAYDDEVVPISESQAYAGALAAVGVDVETHFFAGGGHGFGPGRADDGTSQWLDLLVDWIRRR